MSISQALVQKLIDRGHEVAENAVKSETDIDNKLNNR